LFSARLFHIFDCSSSTQGQHCIADALRAGAQHRLCTVALAYRLQFTGLCRLFFDGHFAFSFFFDKRKFYWLKAFFNFNIFCSIPKIVAINSSSDFPVASFRLAQPAQTRIKPGLFKNLKTIKHLYNHT
jgi:hypothetical protein